MEKVLRDGLRLSSAIGASPDISTHAFQQVIINTAASARCNEVFARR